MELYLAGDYTFSLYNDFYTGVVVPRLFSYEKPYRIKVDKSEEIKK